MCLAYSQTAPTTDAPTPTADAADVISIFSDAYTDVATNYNPNWGQSGHGTVNTAFDPTGNATNFVLAYTNFNYQGTELTQTDASAMDYLHVDVWSPADPSVSILQVSPINNGTGAAEVLTTIDYATGTWTSVDIPKASFTEMTWDGVFQLKFAANGAGSTTPIDVYLDNVYLWRETFLSLVGDLTPEVFALHQNYPNPFNPITQIKYDLPEDALVNITIYDLMGRSIKSLVNSNQSAGYRSIQWNATNNLGEPVSAGMYIYALQAGEFRQTKKMVLLK